jgi:NAD(P)-dependent dehydrogenase (short-subunit alcohol dehydrogenase family)
VSFTKHAALDLAAHGITVNAIAPGPIRTEGTFSTEGTAAAGAVDDVMKSPLERMPMGRWGVPGDIAKGAAFLASPGADFITGTTILVDGGFLLS